MADDPDTEDPASNNSPNNDGTTGSSDSQSAGGDSNVGSSTGGDGSNGDAGSGGSGGGSGGDSGSGGGSGGSTDNPTGYTYTPVSVSCDVELIPQPTSLSCWAASLAMVVSYRDHASITAEDVAAKASMDTATGYNWGSIQQAVSAWQLNQEGPVCALPDYWAQLLQSCGPLWVVEWNKMDHAVVLSGISGDGTPENTMVTLNNPLPVGVGAVQQTTFVAFDNDFGLAAGARAMIVHA